LGNGNHDRGARDEDDVQARLRVSADSEALGKVESFIAKFAARQGLGTDDTARLAIVLDELLSNVMKHGGQDRSRPGTAEIALGLDGTRLTIEFVDSGPPFDPFVQPTPDLALPLEERPVGGLGIHILRSLVEEARYQRLDGCNVIQLTRQVSLGER